MIKIVLIVDNVLFRSALAAAIGGAEDLQIVSATGGTDVPPDGWGGCPDVAIVDLDTSGDQPFAVVREVAQRLSGCRILVLTNGSAPNALGRALHAQVRGFVSKDSDIARLCEAVRTVAAGGTVAEARVALAALSLPKNPLTVREVEVLQLVALGLPVSDIAEQLYLTGGTVRNYLSTILRKVGARNRLEAVRNAQDARWL